MQATSPSRAGCRTRTPGQASSAGDTQEPPRRSRPDGGDDTPEWRSDPVRVPPRWTCLTRGGGVGKSRLHTAASEEDRCESGAVPPLSPGSKPRFGHGPARGGKTGARGDPGSQETPAAVNRRTGRGPRGGGVEPDRPGPGAGEPGAAEPGTGEPGTGEPGAPEPGTGDAGTAEPGTGDAAALGTVARLCTSDTELLD